MWNASLATLRLVWANAFGSDCVASKASAASRLLSASHSVSCPTSDGPKRAGAWVAAGRATPGPRLPRLAFCAGAAAGRPRSRASVGTNHRGKVRGDTGASPKEEVFSAQNKIATHPPQGIPSRPGVQAFRSSAPRRSPMRSVTPRRQPLVRPRVLPALAFVLSLQMPAAAYADDAVEAL